MADLNEIQSAGTTKIVGSTSAGVEQTPVESTVDGRLKVEINSDATVNAFTAPQSYDMFSIGQQVNMASSGTDNPLILLKNPSGSTKRIMVWQLFAGVNVTNTNALFKVFSDPTITSDGTTLTAHRRKIGQTYTASATVFSIPTLSALGNQIHAFSFGQNSNASSIVSDFSLMLEPNNTLVITGSPSSNNREAVITLIWTEVPL